MQTLKTIAFDADDTLWHNEQFFQITQQYFRMLLADHAEPEHLSERLLEAEKRNLKHFGYGVKGFTLSMIETAIEVTDGRVPAETIREILEAGRDMLSAPVELLPGVRETLSALKDEYRLGVITKGDLFDQERKVAQSGLGDFFDFVEIVSEKEVPTYARIFGALDGAEASMMVGNSLKSDIIPALDAGAWATWVPHELTWELEHAEEPVGAERYRRISLISEIPIQSHQAPR